MAKQTINIGTSANDRTGDPLRTAFTKVNQNFTEVYNSIVTDISDLTDTQNLLYLANTGDITFDGVKVIGGGTASGDGNGYSTIELVPDDDLYVNDQYIIIDPTAPNHIHLRAGGMQDNSSADLFVGAEYTNIRVSDGSDNVIVTTSQIGEGITTFSWVFDNQGNFTFPDLSVQTTAWSGGSVIMEPNTSIGSSTDKQGDIAFDSSYLYYCSADYDGNTDIWKRVAWSNDTW